MEKYYAILGLKPGASIQDIRRAYRTLAKKYHPDRNQGDPAAAEKFKEINEAYHALTDPNFKARPNVSGKTSSGGADHGWKDTGAGDGSKSQKGFGGQEFKNAYDAGFRDRYKTYGGFNVGDEKFGFGFDRKNYGGRVVEEKDIYVDVECSFGEMMSKGVNMSASIDRKVLCTACGGKPKVCRDCGGKYPYTGGCRTCGGTGAVKCKHCNGDGFIILNKKVAISIDVRRTPVKINKGDLSHYALLRFAGIGNQVIDFGGNVVSGDMYFRMKITDVPEGVSFHDGDIVQHVSMTMADFLRGEAFNKVSCATHDISGLSLNEHGRAELRVPGGGIAKDLDGNVGDYVFDIEVAAPDVSRLSASDREKLAEILEKL